LIRRKRGLMFREGSSKKEKRSDGGRGGQHECNDFTAAKKQQDEKVFAEKKARKLSDQGRRR